MDHLPLLHLSLNPYNRWGVILMQSISFVPFNAMFLSGILEKLDEGSLRSARDLGASGGAILRDIVLPLIRPATLVCLLLSFVRSLADSARPSSSAGASARWPQTSICKSLDTRTLKSPRQ